MNLKPVQTVVIVAVFLLIGGSAAWFTLKGTATHGPGDIGLDAYGNLYAHYKERVFKFDSAGNDRAAYDLSAIGASGLWGGISVFPDGDLLIVPQGPEIENTLHRCNPSGELFCQPLADSTLQFDRTFRTAIDNQSRIYLSDPGRRTLSLHDTAGAQIAVESSLSRRPGEVKLYGQTLAVADVANTQMKLLTLDASDGTWLGEIQSFDTSPTQASESANNQPVDFIRHQDMWYVLVEGAGMSDKRLRRFTLDGDYLDDVPLPDIGTIIAMEKLDDSIVLSDFANKRLLRIGFNGAPMPDLSSREWEVYQQQLEASGKTMRWAGMALWVLFALMVVAGLVVAIVLEKRRAQASPAGSDKPDRLQSKTAPPSQYDTSITWVGRSNEQKYALMFVGLVLAAAIGFVLSRLQPSNCIDQAITIMIFVMLGMFFIVLYTAWREWKRSSSTRLGVVNEWVVATLPDGSFVRSRAVDLKLVSNVLLLIEDRKIKLGDGLYRFFQRQEFEQYIEPQLQFAQVLGVGELLKWRWQHERKAEVLDKSFRIVLFVLALAFYFGGGTEAFNEAVVSWFTDTVTACEHSSDAAGATSSSFGGAAKMDTEIVAGLRRAS